MYFGKALGHGPGITGKAYIIPVCIKVAYIFLLAYSCKRTVFAPAFDGAFLLRAHKADFRIQIFVIVA